MKREIKFRAWQKSHKTMWYDGGHMNLSLRIEGGLYTPDPYYGNGHDKDFILMQYTGLKDKNGNEIYEGDIVKDNEGFTTKVGFSEGIFYIQNIPERPLKNYQVEIISNIYENPELLIKQRVLQKYNHLGIYQHNK